MAIADPALLQRIASPPAWVLRALLALACTATPVEGAGRIDPTYGRAGVLRAELDQPNYGQYGGFFRVLPAPDDRLYLISFNSGDNCCLPPVFGVELVDRRGVSVWGKPVFLEPAVETFDAEVRPNGGLLVGSANFEQGFIAALDATGRPDPIFDGRSELVLDAPVTALASLPDGRLLVATLGKRGFDAEGNELCLDEGWTLRRLNVDGTSDPGFGSDGRLRSAQVDSVEGVSSCRISRLFLEADGRIILDSRGTYRLNANGTVDASFRNDDPLWLGLAPFTRLVDGGWLTTDSLPRGAPGETDTHLTRYDGNGAIDRSFGPSGNGSVAVDLGELNTGDSSAWDSVPGSFEIPDDGLHYFATAWTYRRSAAADPLPSGQVVARFLRDGRLDSTFGRGGVARLTTGTEPAVVGMVPQSDGGLVVATRHSVFRLYGTDEPSPGAIDVRLEQPVVFENAGPARVVISRNAGSDLPISVTYQTVQQSALAGADYEAVTGRLDWAAGDSSDRIVEVLLINDSDYEPSVEFLQFELNVASGGALNFAPSTLIGIADEGDPAPAPSGGGGTSGGGTSSGSSGGGGTSVGGTGSGSGGGGSSGLVPLVLLVLLLARQSRHSRRARAATRPASVGV
jgi:uncharacterized membrane protein YgcG